MTQKDPEYDIIRTEDGFLALKTRKVEKDATKETITETVKKVSEEEALELQKEKLSQYTIAELKTIADENSIPHDAKIKKADLVDKLVESGVFVEE